MRGLGKCTIARVEKLCKDLIFIWKEGGKGGKRRRWEERKTERRQEKAAQRWEAGRHTSGHEVGSLLSNQLS